MNATIHLVRHAAHDDLGVVLTGRGDSAPLSRAGREQASAVAGSITARPVDAVLSSPRTRAVETAAKIAAAAGVAVETAAAFDEIDFGDWTGRRFAELDGDPAWTRWNTERSSARPPGGEAMIAAQARAIGCVERVARIHADGRVVVVSHCDIIRGVVAHVLGLSLDRLLSFDVDPASTTTLVIGAWGARLTGLNWSAEQGDI